MNKPRKNVKAPRKLRDSIVVIRRQELDKERAKTAINAFFFGVLDHTKAAPTHQNLDPGFLMHDARNFNAVYSKFGTFSLKPKALTDFLRNVPSAHDWKELSTPKNLRILEKDVLSYLSTHFPTCLGDSKAVEYAQLVSDVLTYDFSTTSLLGNDDYDDFKDFSKLLSQINVEDLPVEFKKNLIHALFEPEGALEWSVDASSRRQSIRGVWPLYENPKVKAIFDELKVKEKETLGKKIVYALNMVSGMVSQGEMSLPLHAHIVEKLKAIAIIFEIDRDSLKSKVVRNYSEDGDTRKTRKLETLDAQVDSWLN